MKAKKAASLLLSLFLSFSVMTACSAEKSSSDSSTAETTTTEQTSAAASETPTSQAKLSLDGKSLFVYCGAGMTKPFTAIAEAFQNETGAIIEVSYANAAQITSQITASNEGDLFIAGDQNELTSIQDTYVAETKPLVKHIPVLAVQTGNPKNIKALADLANADVTLVLGDNEATPIGKIADKALTDAGILDKVTVAARTTTAPEIATALSLKQCDAAIIWKENTSVDGVEVVETTDMDKYIKTIPAASLKCSTNTETLTAFLDYLDTDSAKNIWTKHGYELLN